MRPPLHLRFVDKAAAAITAAVEIYNKPSFAYREETFAILALNAWELLLKAKVLKDAGNAIGVLRVYETREIKAGGKSKKLYVKKNRTGNPLSISMMACVGKLDKTENPLPNEVKANLDALMAIRDNSIHFITASSTLARQAQELAAASVRNFVLLSKFWFKRDFSDTLSLVLPLSFIGLPADAAAVIVTADETRLIEHLKSLAQETEDRGSDYAVAIKVQLKLERSSLTTASLVQIAKGGNAIKIQLSEQDIREKYPWDYNELCRRLSLRYIDFKQNQIFHDIRTSVMNDETFVKSRYLDPGNPKTLKKDFYNANVLHIFDKHYTKK